MALVTQFTCQHCKQPRYELVVASRICAACRTAIDKADTEAHMAKLAAMPIEERVRRIELSLYKLDTERRIAVLESYHAKF